MSRRSASMARRLFAASDWKVVESPGVVLRRLGIVPGRPRDVAEVPRDFVGVPREVAGLPRDFVLGSGRYPVPFASEGGAA